MIKTFRNVLLVALAVFIFAPIVYGVGSMFVDVWRDMLPYDWTHSAGGCSYGGHGRHHYHAAKNS